jgi:hypothetical protein
MIPDPSGVASVLGWTLKKVFAGAGGDLAMAPINALAGGLADGVGDMLATLGTLWIRLDTSRTSGTARRRAAPSQFLHSEVAPLVGLLAVLGIIIGAARLAWRSTRSRALISSRAYSSSSSSPGCGVPMIGLLTSGADAWSQSIINDAIQGGDFGRNITAMLSLSGPRSPRCWRSSSGSWRWSSAPS